MYKIIQALFDRFEEIRHVAIYHQEKLIKRQRILKLDGASSDVSDTYEELLVNPTLIKLATQRGDIDCGGLKHIMVFYGSFIQLVKSIDQGHISICIDSNSDLNSLPNSIFTFTKETFEI